ncbi:RNA 2',3'-cyclic phosphodiesterase [bacterium HR29]|jgi:2'-5' RNA ligase|nr:RNA 2',3'-cyclic phosphodiesterase [bacterium HR29]
MPVVVSLLEEPAAGHLRTLWEGLEREFGLQPPASPPHLTYHAAEAYDLERVGAALKSLGRSLPPFTVRCEGLALFPADPAVLSISVVRTPRLTLLQRNVFEEVRGHARDGSPYHHPDRWMPHLTLARGTFAPDVLGAMVAWLVRQELSFEVAVTNLGVIDGEGSAVICRHELTG